MGILKNKVAVVTGSSSGIGRAVALALANRGASIVAADIKQEANPCGFEEDISITTLDLLRNAKRNAIFIQCDVSNPNDVRNLVEQTVNTFQRIDILCNNVGICNAPRSIIDTTDEDIVKMMRINFMSVWYCCQQVIARMLKQNTGGKIINITSIAATRGIKGHPGYCASKGAVAALSRQLAIEYGMYGININSVAPGWIKTSMQRFKKQREREELYCAITPLGRIGLVEEIANTVAFLASSDSDYIQGQEIVVDGGHTLRWDSMAELEN
jgi:NAD(P)-dependent dehydrogenase (short-subunit alcohol dehydrogenase family)